MRGQILGGGSTAESSRLEARQWFRPYGIGAFRDRRSGVLCASSGPPAKAARLRPAAVARVLLFTLCVPILQIPALSQELAPARVVIADQFGPGHLVSVVIKRKGLLEKRFPGTEFDWRVLTSGAVVRDGMMTGRIHVGVTAPPPFLLGIDKGVKWKMLAGAATYDQWLVVEDPNIRSLKDFKSAGQKQIGLVGLDSFPALALRKAAKHELGDPKALDDHMVLLPPPQAIQAVATGQLAGAFVPPLFNVMAVDQGSRMLLSSGDVFGGPVTNNFYVMMEATFAAYPAFAKGFYDSVIEAIDTISNSPEEAFRLLAEDEGGKRSPAEYRRLMERSGTTFGATPRGVLAVGKFMEEIGTIKSAPTSIGEISLPSLGDAGS